MPPCCVVVFVVVVLLVAVASSTVSPPVNGAKDFRNLTRRQVLNMLLDDKDFDSRIPPDYEQDYPTNVSLQIHVISFDSINAQSMDYSMNMYLRERWVDHRLSFLAYDKAEWLELDTRMLDKLWVPDVYFRNEKSATIHSVTVPNRLIHIYRNGTVNYSLRLSLTLTCNMHLERYPLDSQKCPIVIQSYSYTVDNVVFHWAENNAIDVNQNMEMPQFIYKDAKTIPCSDLFEKRFACVMAEFHLKRDIGYFIVQVYIPSCLIVILSWISFWIDVGAVPARISLGVLTVLTMTTMSSGAQASLPRVSYVKSIDVWMASCLIFVFAALLEFAWVNVLQRRCVRTDWDKDVLSPQQREALKADTENNLQNHEVVYESLRHRVSRKLRIQNARKIDKVSRIAFPMAFILFNVVYWGIYATDTDML